MKLVDLPSALKSADYFSVFTASLYTHLNGELSPQACLMLRGQEKSSSSCGLISRSSGTVATDSNSLSGLSAVCVCGSNPSCGFHLKDSDAYLVKGLQSITASRLTSLLRDLLR
jgi:hypothetical protein